MILMSLSQTSVSYFESKMRHFLLEFWTTASTAARPVVFEPGIPDISLYTLSMCRMVSKLFRFFLFLLSRCLYTFFRFTKANGEFISLEFMRKTNHGYITLTHLFCQTFVGSLTTFCPPEPPLIYNTRQSCSVLYLCYSLLWAWKNTGHTV